LVAPNRSRSVTGPSTNQPIAALNQSSTQPLTPNHQPNHSQSSTRISRDAKFQKSHTTRKSKPPNPIINQTIHTSHSVSPLYLINKSTNHQKNTNSTNQCGMILLLLLLHYYDYCPTIQNSIHPYILPKRIKKIGIPFIPFPEFPENIQPFYVYQKSTKSKTQSNHSISNISHNFHP
jgi:hypothetical protein